MRSSIKRIAKTLLYTSVVGAGGYYLYNTYRVKNLQNVTQSTPIINPQKLQTSIPSLLQHEEHQPHTIQQKQNLQQQKSEIINHSSHQKTQEKPTQINLQAQKITQISQPQATQPQKPSTQSVAAPQTSTSQTLLLSQKKQKSQNTVQQKIVKIDLSKLIRLSELPELPIKPQQQLKTVLIVADMGFTQQFEQKLLQTIRNVRKIPNSQQIKIYRANVSNPQIQQQLSKAYGHKIKEETIFLLKNQLDDNFVDINFDMYMQYPALINTYMTKLNLYNQNNQKQCLRKLQKMSPNESYLMFVYDDSQSAEKKAKSLLAAKYIQMELALHHLDQSVKVFPIEATVAKTNGLIPQDKIRSKSLHIIRKHNQFTHANPNIYLKLNQQIKPYHLIVDIGFHNKRGQVAVQQYLQKIQTFNSLSITTPYLLSLTIDKNRISTENYKLLLETFREIKKRNQFPEVGIALKFSQIGYLGKDEPENNQFCIKMANVAELQNQSSIHQITNLDDAKNMGITQQNWLKNSYEFLYPHQAISQELLNDFVEKVLLGHVPQYYRSDKPSSIQNVHKIVASNFDKQILQNSLDHFVFEYSDHCPSCKLISPLIAYMNDILQPIPIDKRFDIHVMNCHKNRVKGQVYSPYTPNMNYFKNDWKQTGPVRIGLQTIKYGGLQGLYNFCIITNMLKTIDTKKFNETIQNSKLWNKAEFVL